MKKILALTLLTCSLSSTLLPVFAITEDTSKKQEVKQEKKKWFSSKKDNLKSQAEYINLDWWKNLGDSHLENYINLALEKNNDIKLASLALEQAQINVMQARSVLMPDISIGASPILLKMPGTSKSDGSIAIPVMAQYEIDLFGKNWDKTKSAKKLLEGVVYQTQASDIAVVSLVGATYYNIVKLDEMIETQEKLVKERQEIYRLMKISNKEGLVSTSDLIIAEKNYVLSQNDLLDYKKNRQNALNALAVLIGDSAENVGEYKRISYKELSDKINIPSEISSEIIVNRPDYKSVEKQLESAGLDVRAAKKEFLPTLNILGLLTFIADSSLGGMDWKNALVLAGGGLNLPIFDGFSRSANLKLNKNKYKQLVEKYQQTNLVAIQEVNDSLYNLKTDNEKFLNNKKALNIQRQDYKLSKKKYEQGVISKLDLLQQLETLLYVQQLETASKMDCYIDKISLYKTTGARI